MLYGKQECVNYLLRDMAAQKLPLKFYKEGEPDRHNYVECQIRILPFGIYEFIFPKEHKDVVLTTLNFQSEREIAGDGTSKYPYYLNREVSIMGFHFKPLDYLKKFLKIEDIPDFETNNRLPWWDMHIAIIPIGVRYDGEIEEVWGPNAGFKHEAI